MLMDSEAAGLDVAAARLAPARAPESTAFLLLFFPRRIRHTPGLNRAAGAGRLIG